MYAEFRESDSTADIRTGDNSYEFAPLYFNDSNIAVIRRDGNWVPVESFNVIRYDPIRRGKLFDSTTLEAVEV